jgi:NCS1 nucleoside transporter family
VAATLVSHHPSEMCINEIILTTVQYVRPMIPSQPLTSTKVPADITNTHQVAFWIADSFNLNTWMISSASILDPGLAWWQSWLCVWIGYAIAGGFIILTGRIGAQYHIAFPVVGRSSFGIWGSLWPVLNRSVMACVWYGVQSWIGGEYDRQRSKIASS